MARGFVDLAAVVDWFSRRVLSWRLSITLEADFCIEAVEKALARHGKPDIFNTDQGSQFTSIAVIKTLKDAEPPLRVGERAGAVRSKKAPESLLRQTAGGESEILRDQAAPLPDPANRSEHLAVGLLDDRLNQAPGWQ